MKKLLFFGLALMLAAVTFAQVGIGTSTPDASSILDLTATDKGLLLPRITSAERNAISNPATGLMVFNTTLSCLQVNDGTPASPVWNCISNFAGIPDGVIATIDCAGATNNGTLTIGVLT